MARRQGLREGYTVRPPSDRRRRRGGQITWRALDGTGTFYMNCFYYWVGALEILPAVWRWNKACGQEPAASGDDTLRELGESLVRRVQRVLEARDRFHGPSTYPRSPTLPARCSVSWTPFSEFAQYIR